MKGLLLSPLSRSGMHERKYKEVFGVQDATFLCRLLLPQTVGFVTRLEWFHKPWPNFARLSALRMKGIPEPKDSPPGVLGLSVLRAAVCSRSDKLRKAPFHAATIPC